LSGLSDCTEWIQLVLLKILLEYDTDDMNQIENILDRMLSRLSHINPAVVFYSSKVIIKFSQKLKDETLFRGVLRKLSSPFVSLMSGNHEFVYVLLKNFQVLVKVRNRYQSNCLGLSFDLPRCQNLLYQSK
jgi:AP-1 complex subunit beta-1